MDYVLHRGAIEAKACLDVPSEESIAAMFPSRLPNETHPSDHLCMVVDVELTSPERPFDIKKEGLKKDSTPQRRKEVKKEAGKDRKPPPKPPRAKPSMPSVTEGWVPPAPRDRDRPAPRR